MPHATIASPLHPLSDARATTGPVVVAVGGHDPVSALRAARAFAHHSPGGILALAVLEPLSVYAFGEEPRILPPNFEAERQAALQARLDTLVREASEEPGAWRTEIQLGDPAHVIPQVAAREHAPLIIMGIGRHGIMDRLLQRETTIRTVRLARCPVLAVCEPFLAPPKCVVVGTDFSAESALAAQVAASIMAENGSMVFVHAWQTSVVSDPLFANVLGNMDADYEQRLPARFERLHKAVPAPAGVTMRDIQCRGDAAREVLHHAEDMHADLIAVGSHGAGALERLLVGSVASGVLRRSRCSVLVAPTPSAMDRERLQLLVSGSSESWAPVAWSEMLGRFSDRNRGRLTTLEVNDPILGAYTQESGYPFQGAAYDPHDERIELMFGTERAGRTHLTRGISSAHAVTVEADTHGMDTSLSIAHEGAETVIRFTTPAPPR